ncbi:putative phage abortive infection protein [Aeromonas sp. s10]|uniref:putative phage abortive infection protein n=1 Tax=Aeromonas sp. s10 TaxID=3138480 RepID=UPI0034A34938
MSKSDNKNGWYFIIFILVVVLVVWYFYPFWSYWYKDSFDNVKLLEMGVFGDSYGALNTLFSALAFTGIIASIYFQREELKATREELEATRYEMKYQGEQFEAQTTALKLQVFENTFFNMLKLFNDIVESMAIPGLGGNIITGRRCFRQLCEDMADYQYRSDMAGLDCISIYEAYYIAAEDKIGHYNRVMYQLFELVVNSALHEEQKVKYIEILRAQLSTYELILLSMHSSSKYGGENAKRFVEVYSLLECISIKLFVEMLNGSKLVEEVIKGYEICAYGNQREEVLMILK